MSLKAQRGERLANLVAVLKISRLPRFGVPDFDLLDDSHDHHILRDPRVLAVGRGDQDAALLVEFAFRRRREQEPSEVLDLLFHQGERLDLLLEPLPRLERIDREAAVVVHGEHEPSVVTVGDDVAELRWYAYSPLGINGMFVAAPEHDPPLCHRPPLHTTCLAKYIIHEWQCQEKY